MKDVNKFIDKSDYNTLKRSYIDACSNKDFYNYVSNLPIEENTLIKYTSTLEESFKEFENCKNCKSLSNCKNKIKGYKFVPEKTNNNITFSYTACERKIKQDEKNKYLENIKYYDISTDLSKASFKDVYKDDKKRVPILKYMTEFIKDYTKGNKPKGIYLNGSFESGKTYLTAALFNDLAKRGIKCAIVYYPEFLRDLKASFKTDYDDKFNYIKKVPILLLDDIGAENVSNYNRDEVLGPILQYRMEEELPTFFTSNLTIEELEKNLSITTTGADKIKARRIVERIKQLTISLELVSKNRRV